MSRAAPAISLASRLRARFPARLAAAGLATIFIAGSLAAVTAADAAGARTSAAAVASPAGVNVGAATTYSVLGSTSVTNTGSTFIEGELGVSPGTVVTGFPPGVIGANGGQPHSADTSAANAQQSTQAAYTDAQSRVPTAQFPYIYDIGSSTFGPGVYQFPSSLGITGTVTLDGGGDPRSVFIFQAGSTLITETYSKVVLLNGAQAANVFWQVGTSATLKIGSTFAGTILAHDSITAQTNVSVHGRALAIIGAVTLDTDTFGTAPPKVAAPAVPMTPTSPTTPTTATDQAAPGAPATVNTSNRPTRQLPTLVFDPTANRLRALTPGEAILAFTGGSIAGAVWGVLSLAVGVIFFIWAHRRRRKQQET